MASKKAKRISRHNRSDRIYKHISRARLLQNQRLKYRNQFAKFCLSQSDWSRFSQQSDTVVSRFKV
jgi:hypothetical protein